MKTVEDFIKEIDSSDELQNEIKAIKDKDAFEAFLKKNDVEGTVEDFGRALHVTSSSTEGEISDEEAEAAAGGRSSYIPEIDWIQGLPTYDPVGIL